MNMNLDELKSKLGEFLDKNSIAQFGPDDVLELIGEGESVDWIVRQLKGDKPIDVEAVTSLLTEMKRLAAPDEKPPEAQEVVAEAEAGLSDFQIDPSQLDLSQLGDMLPEGMQMPPGLDAEEIMNLLESPQGKVMTDFVTYCQEKGIDPGSIGINDSRTERLRSEWLVTPRDAFKGKTPAEMLLPIRGKVETFRRAEPQAGRNDPCPCGSGKKYKKCCGRT